MLKKQIDNLGAQHRAISSFMISTCPQKNLSLSTKKKFVFNFLPKIQFFIY